MLISVATIVLLYGWQRHVKNQFFSFLRPYETWRSVKKLVLKFVRDYKTCPLLRVLGHRCNTTSSNCHTLLVRLLAIVTRELCQYTIVTFLSFKNLITTFPRGFHSFSKVSQIEDFSHGHPPWMSVGYATSTSIDFTPSTVMFQRVHTMFVLGISSDYS